MCVRVYVYFPSFFYFFFFFFFCEDLFVHVRKCYFDVKTLAFVAHASVYTMGKPSGVATMIDSSLGPKNVSPVKR